MALRGQRFAAILGLAAFVEDGKCLAVTLNDGKTVVYHDPTSGAAAKKPASEVNAPGAVVVALSRDRRYAVTAPARPQSHHLDASGKGLGLIAWEWIAPPTPKEMVGSSCCFSCGRKGW